MRTLLLLVGIALLEFGCSGGSHENSAQSIEGKDSLKADSANVFVLPAPMQVATFLHNHNAEFNQAFLSSLNTDVSVYTTEYERALNLGISLTDAAYAALSNNRQIALDYLARAEQLSRSLRLEQIVGPYVLRLKRNTENPDSVSFLILSLYSDAQRNLNDGLREKTAFYIGSGCFLEGTALFVQHDHLRTHTDFCAMMAQQKLWLDNYTEALTYLEPNNETQDLYNTFFTLQDCYKEFVITTDSGRPTAKFNDAAFNKLKAKSIQLRNEITGQ
jgi:hypothetical protein